ncbi:MAG: PAS domain S-box protein [Elainella sp. Prado103]|nr:PAS domain S-box protein [Elainella sp. Prado103]
MQFPQMQVIQPCSLLFAPNDLVQTAVSGMSQAYLSYALVVEENRLVGILTERDITKATAIGIPFATTPISELMTTPVITCTEAEATDLLMVIQMMQQHKLRHLPVLNEQSELVGIITASSIYANLKPEYLLSQQQVSQVMTTSIVQAPPDVSLQQLANLMVERQVGCVVIVMVLDAEQTAKETVEETAGTVVSAVPTVDQSAYAAAQYAILPGSPPRSSPWQMDGMGCSPSVYPTPQPIGIITERDILQFQALGLDLTAIRADSAMSTPLSMIDAQANLWEAQQRMQQLRVRRLVVSDRQYGLRGIITQTDILRVINPFTLHEVIYSLQQVAEQQNQLLQAAQQAKAALTQELVQSNQRYQSILNHLPDLICCFRQDGILTFANRAYCEYFNQPLQALVGQSILTGLPGDRGISTQHLARLTTDGNRITHRHQVINGKGELRWMESTDCAIWDDAGNLVEFQSIGRDITDQLEVEQLSRTQEARNRAILNAMPDLLLRVLRDGTCLDCILPPDRQGHTFLPVQHHIAEVLPPEAVQVRLRLIEQALETGELQVAEDQFVRQDRVICEEIRAIACGQDEVLLMVRDMTQRRQSETQFRRLSENVLGIIYRYRLAADGTEQMLYLSPRSREILETAPEQILAEVQYLWALVHPEDIADLRQKLTLSAQTLHPYQAEFRLILPGGTKWIRIFARPECHVNHDIIWDGLALDITEAKQANEALRISEAKLRSILAHSPSVMSVIDRQGTTLFINCALMGRAADTWVGRSMTAYLQPEQEDCLENALQTVFGQGRSAYFEATGIGKTDPVANYEVYIAPIHPPREDERSIEAGIVIAVDVSMRKQAETTLHKRDAQLRLALEASKIVCWETDLTTQQTTCIGRHLSHHQWHSETWQLPYSDFLQQIHPDDQNQFAQKTLEAISTGGEFEDVHRLYLPNHSMLWVLVKAKLFPDLRGQFNRLVGVSINLSDRKQAEIALQASEARFRAIFEQAAVGITQATLAGQYIQVNQWFCQLLGYSEAELLQANIADVTHPDDWSHNHRLIQQLIAGEISALSVEKRYICKDGQVRWVHISGSLVQDELHQQQYLLGVIEDVQERKQAEMQIQSQQAFLRKVIDAVSSAIFVKDPWNRFVIANQACADIYGVTVEDLIGENDLSFNTDTQQVEEFWAINRDVLSSRISRTIHTQSIPTADGKKTWYRATISPFIDTNGQARGVIGVISDITDLKHTELALRQAKEAAEAASFAKSQFLANMSHELRTPLNSILGFAQLLNRDHGLTAEQREYLNIILRSGEHLLALINDVLEMSKIDAGSIPFNVNGFDLYLLLDNLQEMLSIKAISKGLELIFERSDVPQYIQTDENKLRQVLLNLLGNAIKFTMSGQVKLQLQLAPLPPYYLSEETHRRWLARFTTDGVARSPHMMMLCCKVEDTGPGIAESEIDHLFNPFVQTEAGRRSQEGTGLGLAISHRFVELMGGNIQVHSQLGYGSCFSFQVPICPAEPTSFLDSNHAQSIVALAPNQPVFRILIAEDQLTNRKLVVELLTKLGFEVREAGDGQMAIEQWEQWSPHLILMDMRMPNLDGYEATRYIRQQERRIDIIDVDVQLNTSLIIPAEGEPRLSARLCNSTVIIALTASAFEEERTNIFMAGCNGYIPKPFKSEELLTVIASYLGIDYLYAKLTDELTAGSSAIDPLSNLIQPLQPIDLAVMPTEWRQEFQRAAAQLDVDRCGVLIQTIPTEYGQLIESLKALVNEFRFDRLVELTQPGSSSE